MESKGKPAVKELLENNIFSISAYLKLLNGVLNSFEARIMGEVSEIKISSVGHVYFSTAVSPFSAFNRESKFGVLAYYSNLAGLVQKLTDFFLLSVNLLPFCHGVFLAN